MRWDSPPDGVPPVWPAEVPAGVDWQAATIEKASAGTSRRPDSRRVVVMAVLLGICAETSSRRVQAASVRYPVDTQHRIQLVTRVPRRMPTGEVLQPRLRTLGKHGIFLQASLEVGLDLGIAEHLARHFLGDVVLQVFLALEMGVELAPRHECVRRLRFQQ